MQVSLKAVVSLYNPQRYMMTPTLIPFDRNSDTLAGLKKRKESAFHFREFFLRALFI